MAGDYNEARSHFEFPKYVFVIRVDHEQDVPNLKSKRRYTHQIDWKDFQSSSDDEVLENTEKKLKKE